MQQVTKMHCRSTFSIKSDKEVAKKSKNSAVNYCRLTNVPPIQQTRAQPIPLALGGLSV